MRALTQLRKLPAIFTIADLCRIHDMSRKEAAVYVSRWKSYELVHAAGPRLGIFYNLIVAPEWKKSIPTAIARCFPSPVVIGPSVLHNHGWTTQIPQTIHIAICTEDSVPQMDGVSILRRSSPWFKKAAPYGEKIFGLTALTPEKALLDARRNGTKQKMWVPDIDDLDIPEESLLAGKYRVRQRSSLSM